MKKLLSLLLLAAVMVALATACGDSGPDPEAPDVPLPEPIDVVFTIYSLEGTSSQWTNLYDLPDNIPAPTGELLVIENEEELKGRILGSDYPEIDFSKKTLLLAYGISLYGTHPIPYDVAFQQTSTRGYLLSTKIPIGVEPIIIRWQLAIITNKLPDKSNVKVIATQTTGHKN